jgi:hypothetical protein
MNAPITVNYLPDGEDWTVTVTAGEKTETDRATGLVAARDRADQMVAQFKQVNPTVVHLLDGDAYAFTTSYLPARLGLADPPEPVASTEASA